MGRDVSRGTAAQHDDPDLLRMPRAESRKAAESDPAERLDPDDARCGDDRGDRPVEVADDEEGRSLEEGAGAIDRLPQAGTRPSGRHPAVTRSARGWVTG